MPSCCDGHPPLLVTPGRDLGGGLLVRRSCRVDRRPSGLCSKGCRPAEHGGDGVVGAAPPGWPGAKPLGENIVVTSQGQGVDGSDVTPKRERVEGVVRHGAEEQFRSARLVEVDDHVEPGAPEPAIVVLRRVHAIDPQDVHLGPRGPGRIEGGCSQVCSCRCRSAPSRGTAAAQPSDRDDRTRRQPTRRQPLARCHACRNHHRSARPQRRPPSELVRQILPARFCRATVPIWGVQVCVGQPQSARPYRDAMGIAGTRPAHPRPHRVLTRSGGGNSLSVTGGAYRTSVSPGTSSKTMWR
jgi:hypothetical protein